MDDLLTLKEIAARLGVPESNLRYYRNRIGDFLPSIGKGRRRRYFPESIEIFQKTIEYINDGITLDRIHSIFADNKPLALRDDIARPAQEELANLIVQKLKDSLPALVAGGAAAIDAPTDASADRQEETLLLKEELEALKERNSELELKIGLLESDKNTLELSLADKEALLAEASSVAGAEPAQDASALEEQLESSRTEIEALQARISELEAAASSSQDADWKISSLEQEASTLRDQIESLEQMLAEKEKIMTGQKAALDSGRTKRQALQEEIDRLKAQLGISG